MRKKLNLAIVSINNARQALGRKSDADHVHDDQQGKFEAIHSEMAMVRSNMTSLIADVNDVRQVATDNAAHEDYGKLMEEVRVEMVFKYERIKNSESSF